MFDVYHAAKERKRKGVQKMFWNVLKTKRLTPR